MNADNPLLLRFADWVWGGKASTAAATTGEISIISPEICLADFPFGTSADCWTQVLVKGIGLVLIAASLLVKTPIIRNVWTAQSAAGLSRTAVYGETLVYANSACYGFLRNLPWTAYGEYLALVVQSTTLIGLTWWFSGDDAAMTKVSPLEQITAIGVATGYVVVATQCLPESKYYWLTSSSLPILLYARGSQIIATHKAKHTGAQSIVSTSMSLGGAMTRVLTTLQEIGFDFGLLVPFFLGLVLNSIVCFQYILYYDNTKAFLAKLRMEKETKKKA